jgi:hypothetical protein
VCGTCFSGITEMTSIAKFVFLFSVVAPAMVQTAGAAPCLKDTSDSETAVGRLAIGKPQQISGTVSRPYILILSAPACLSAANPKENVKGAGTIHIFSSDGAVTVMFPELVGKKVTVSGRPMLPHTRFHRAPIIMDVTAIKPL